ncbi:MAG: ACP S-malonyltransferase [Legionella sp.]|nr:ACP S-malonyltransferase [Legionella sp.]
MQAFIFPGQGSQFKGMGGELFNEFPELIAKADTILDYSIKKLCLEDPHQQLNHTQYTQPALYTVNALTYFKKIQDTKIKPDFVAGHSLGEYNALLSSEVFDFETGLQLVKKRGELMSQATGGAMIAVVGLKVATINDLLMHNDLMNVAIANDNSHTQVVLSGAKEDITRAHRICEQSGALMVVPLKVSGAFHSPYMQSAQQQFQAFLDQFQFSPPLIPVIANYTALPYTAGDVHQNLTQQITYPVRWTESIEYLLNQKGIEFQEIGAGTVLTGLVRRIKNSQ